MKKKWIKSLIISCFLLCVCFGLSACKEKDSELKYTLNIYVDNAIYQTVELKESEIETYTLPEMELKKDELYYFSGWTGDVKDNKLKVNSYSSIISISGSYKPIFYVSENGELEVTKNETTKSFEELVIPSSINDINVISLNDNEFRGFNNLKTISLPSTLQTISYCAFEDCVNLEEVNIGENSELEEIGSYAFNNCENLKSITIPKGVIKIGNDAFKNCYKLGTINYNAVNCAGFIDGIKYKLCFDNTGINTDGVTLNIGNLVTNIPVGLCWNAINVVNINLKEINFSENTICETIGESSFERCYNLNEVTIPETIKEIGFYAFEDCYNLNEINYNAKNVSDTEFNKQGFCNAGNNSQELVLNIGENVESIPAHMFMNNDITEINFSNNIKCTTIKEYAFYACEKLQEITIPENIANIGENAFAYCTNLEIINFNAIECSNFEEEDYPFDPIVSEHKLYKVIFGSQVKKVPDYIFNGYGCDALQEVEFAENSVCESIGNKAFYGCKDLQKLEISKNITLIGEKAFASCNNIRELYYNASACAGYTRSNTPFSCSGNVGMIVYIGKDVEYIPDYMFNMAQNISHVIFDKESKCDAISTGAFYYCNNIEYIILSSQVASIEDFALEFSGDAQVDIYCLGLGEPEMSSISDIENIYHYMETQPQENGKYWHYDTDGKTPIIWE